MIQSYGHMFTKWKRCCQNIGSVLNIYKILFDLSFHVEDFVQNDQNCAKKKRRYKVYALTDNLKSKSVMIIPFVAKKYTEKLFFLAKFIHYTQLQYRFAYFHCMSGTIRSLSLESSVTRTGSSSDGGSFSVVIGTG